LVGTPLVQLPASNYKIIGKGSTDPTKIVTIDVNIRVNRERVLLDVCGTTQYLGITPGVPIDTTVVTARAPPYGSANIRYTWTPSLLDGLTFKDIFGNVLSSGSVPTDASSTIIFSGTPTDAAAKSVSGPYSIALTANRVATGADASSTRFDLSFGEIVLFSTPVLQSNYYIGTQVDSNSNYFFAQTKFASTSSAIVGMNSPDIPDGLDISFASPIQRGYLVGTPTFTGSGTFTVFASNTNGTTGSITVPYSISNDQIVATSTSDICYNFVATRALTNPKTGYYPYPIQFSASTLSGCNIVMSTDDLDGTGITLSNVSNNVYQLTGVPLMSVPPSVLTITIESPSTFATKDISLNYAILPETFTFPTKVFTFIQNQAITPYQFSAITLSGRNILNYSSSNLPNNLLLSPGGYLSGIVRVGTSGTFDIVATTGYAAGSNTYTYSTAPDSILLITDPSVYRYNVGDSVSIQIDGFSFSGAAVSNYTFSNFSPSYGLSINSITGAISGTLTGPLPASCNFFVKASVGTVEGTLGATLTSDGTITFNTIPAGGPTFVSPTQPGFLFYQYMPITPIYLDASGTGTSYYYINSNDLPIGLSFDPINQLIHGTPMRTGQDSITVYAKDNVGVTKLALSVNTIIARIVKNQTSAGAYTSLIRQYTEVNAAQNARDNRVYPTQDRAAGEFQAPTAPDVITQVIDPKCKNPNTC
jgi:hypothetical protein